MFFRKSFFIAVLSIASFGITPVRAQTGFQLAEEAGEHLDVLRDGRRLARYVFAYDPSTPQRKHDTYKPFLHVFDSEGKAPITKGPGGSFTHHRGIFIGWSKLSVGGKTIDRWHMKGGEQVHRKFVAQNADAAGATFTSLVEWMGAGPEPALEEERTFTFLPPPAPAYALIEMRSKLKAVAGEAVLGGDPEHAGLHFRPAGEVVGKETVYFFGKEQADPRKDRDYRWFGESFSLRGQRYSVVYLNHPENPKETAVSAYRDYGRFGAFFKTTIPAGGNQVIRVRFLISAGEMPPVEIIQGAWNDFAGANEPAPVVTVRPVSQPKKQSSEPPAP
jgi:hypothetical protein